MAAPCNDVSLLFNLFLPPNHSFTRGGFVPWARDVEQVTEGRVRIRFTSASLSPPSRQWDAVTSGIADVAMVENPREGKRLTLPAIGGLPLLGDTSTRRSVALWRTYEKFFADADEYRGVKLIALFTNSSAGLITNRPIAGVGELSGMKLWSMAGSPARYVRTLGAVAVPAGGPEMLSMFSKGIVDGLATNPGALKMFRLNRYAKTVTEIPGGLYAVDFSLIMRAEKWAAICAADQAAIMSVSGERIARGIGEAVDAFDVQARREAVADGVRVVRADNAFQGAVRDALRREEDAWIGRAATRGVDGHAALAYFRAQLLGE